MGRVRSLEAVIVKSNGRTYTRKSKILKTALYQGYEKGALSIDGKMYSFAVHRLVMDAFVPNDENKETVNHKNGIKTDNKVSNLEWMTRSENCQHSFDTKLQHPKKGSLNGRAILKEQDVKEIRRVAASGKRYYGRKELAEKYKVSEAHIKEIVTRRRNIWYHV